MRREIEYLEAAQSGNGVDLRDLNSLDLSVVQIGALTASLWHHRRAEDESLRGKLASVGFRPDRATILQGHPDNKWWPVVNALRDRRSPLSSDLFRALKGLEEETPAEILLSGVFLSLCALDYYPAEGVAGLTEAFIKSGQVFDYRPHFESEGIKLVRRYPTGGLSEKCALLLPAMVECFGDELNIKSPFSVGRTLGFTGGTWDKLSSIDGFTFPEPGEAVIGILEKGNCAITVTLGEAAPADRVIYRRRSETSTVECDSLIVSSIASKHAAIPVHHMVLDARIGTATFIPDEESANRIGGLIRDALRPRGINLLVSVLENSEPDGSAIGNYLEVLEAMEIIRGHHSGSFDLRGKRTQLSICADFFVKMVSMARPTTDPSKLVDAIEKSIATGRLWEAQKRFLANHSVSASAIGVLENDPWNIMSGVERKEIRSPRDGYLRDINQRSLGRRIYNGFEDGRRDIRLGGIILKKRRYDPVAKGDIICSIYGPGCRSIDEESLLEAIFDLGDQK
jgi:pyrimidine-nucleoside phosphorylase